jgi:hypothetical protein
LRRIIGARFDLAGEAAAVGRESKCIGRARPAGALESTTDVVPFGTADAEARSSEVAATGDPDRL